MLSNARASSPTSPVERTADGGLAKSPLAMARACSASWWSGSETSRASSAPSRVAATQKAAVSTASAAGRRRSRPPAGGLSRVTVRVSARTGTTTASTKNNLRRDRSDKRAAPQIPAPPAPFRPKVGLSEKHYRTGYSTVWAAAARREEHGRPGDQGRAWYHRR